MLLASVVLAVWLNVVHIRWVSGPLGREDDLCRFRLPMAAIHGFTVVVATVTAAILRPALFDSVPWLPWIVANVLLALVCLYALAGLAVLNWFVFRLPIPPWLRLLAALAQALPPLIPMTAVLYVLLGLLDAWFDVRKLDEGGTALEQRDEGHPERRG
jgi:hypothetical protein